MIPFIEDCTIKNIKTKFILLYILNLTDIIFTLLLLSTGYYIEANILMVETVQSVAASFMVKVILPLVLFIFVYIRIKKATDTQLKRSNIIINITTLFYVLINIFHLVSFIFLTFLYLFYE